jgi:proline iminopeptidase
VGDGFASADDGAQLWYTVEGSGVAVVFCHGGPGLWDYLAPLAEPLLDVARVTRWEQRGCGRSERRGPYTTERIVADLDQLRAHLGHDRWIVGGHSWGATVALQYALTHPHRVAGLVYVSGVGLGRAWNRAYHDEADRRLTDAQRTRRDELAAAARSVDEEHQYRVLCWAPDFADRAAALELASALAAASFSGNYDCNAQLNAETKTWDETALAARCRALTVPVLVLHGERDPRPVWALDSLLDALPDGELRVVPGAGHLPWIEAPDLVAAQLRQFIVRVDGETPSH